MDSFNVSVFLAINQFAGTHGLADAIAIVLAEAMPYAFILVLMAVWFGAAAEKRKVSMNAGFSVLLALLVSYFIGMVYFHPRPFMENLGTPLLQHAPDTSLPSDHATFLFAIAFTFLFSPRTRGLGVVLGAFACLGGVARVYAGVHFPMDVLSAALVGVFAASSVCFLSSKTEGLNWIFSQFMKVKYLNRTLGQR
ncbi:undecaprenyl-diphosphatase [Marinobacter sp. X15-166B]|uniref:undecaprenyl-diphosphatase n=1 Tax=Marinobacter sp. X15-166B TaxID=1897620 RepID=UPI00085BD19E|nr:undecaprenyl-diphosphatase [Marinobacter sp. X15-166B]OEY67302.1 hypothetical protein BG841_13195 [Marinobacter sp. X15-166B]